MSAAATQAHNFSIAIKKRSEIPLKDRPQPPVFGADTIWYALITAPQREGKAVSELAKMAGLVTYVPHEIYWTTRTRARQTLKVERCKPLFPRYVFISGAINWYAIAQIEEVAGVMALAGVPRKVPTSELADLARREREGRFDERRRAVLDLAESGPLYQRGDMIRVTGANNPFQGLDALVDGDSNDDKVKVLVSIFGRETPMVLPLSEINMLQAVSRGIESGAVA